MFRSNKNQQNLGFLFGTSVGDASPMAQVYSRPRRNTGNSGKGEKTKKEPNDNFQGPIMQVKPGNFKPFKMGVSVCDGGGGVL
jgi:hypothetical protein